MSSLSSSAAAVSAVNGGGEGDSVLNSTPKYKLCCIGAGYVGGPTCSVSHFAFIIKIEKVCTYCVYKVMI